MRAAAAWLWLACVLLAGCHGEGNPYRQSGNPPGQNSRGTPADRTGGARNVPDGAGGGPGKSQAPPVPVK